MSFLPKYNISINMCNDLMKIQEATTFITQLPLPAYILKQLKHDSMVKTVILSTKIEGNLLDETLKRKAISKASKSSDEQEVYNLWKAIEYLEECEKKSIPITEELIKKLHAIIQVINYGRRSKLSEYRQMQNKVGEKGINKIVYLPPEYKDVPFLMEDLVAWINNQKNKDIPAPIKAGIFMYQFLTIHPYIDGNGRIARALATYILRQGGFGLNGLFVLEKYYDRNLMGYYENLQMGLHHNYYFGRNEANLTPWLDFFVHGLSEVFQDALNIVKEKSIEFIAVEPKLIRELDVYQREVFAQLAFKFNYITISDLVRLTDLADRTVRDKVKKWIESGFIEPYDSKAQRIRAVKLTPRYQKLANEICEQPDRYKHFLK